VASFPPFVADTAFPLAPDPVESPSPHCCYSRHYGLPHELGVRVPFKMPRCLSDILSHFFPIDFNPLCVTCVVSLNFSPLVLRTLETPWLTKLRSAFSLIVRKVKLFLPRLIHKKARIRLGWKSFFVVTSPSLRAAGFPSTPSPPPLPARPIYFPLPRLATMVVFFVGRPSVWRHSWAFGVKPPWFTSFFSYPSPIPYVLSASWSLGSCLPPRAWESVDGFGCDLLIPLFVRLIFGPLFCLCLGP